ncbi:hypothetical protein Trydic_g23134, partial [Trypoxylus dichotomus]
NNVNDNTISQLQLRLEKIECYWDEFNNLQALLPEELDYSLSMLSKGGSDLILRHENKAKPTNTSYLMGNLPEFRANEYLPFTNVGVDYGGPFTIKDRKGRDAKVKLCTILTEIEGILSSHPLCPFSNDPNDLVTITPGHILIGRTLISLPEPSYTSIPENRPTSSERLQAIRQHRWVRWSKEYLTELQTRVKWNLGTTATTENEPPQNWQLGRVTKLYLGGVGVCRGVNV